MTAPPGARLVLPLRRLDDQERSAPELPVLLDLDAPGPGAWSHAVRTAVEICVLLDAGARVVCASASAATVLGAPVGTATGARLVDLISVVDFTSGAAPDREVERAVPPLRALATGGLARGLLRLRSAAGLVTYDVVAVPLSGGAGVLAFFVAV